MNTPDPARPYAPANQYPPGQDPYAIPPGGTAPAPDPAGPAESPQDLAVAGFIERTMATQGDPHSLAAQVTDEQLARAGVTRAQWEGHTQPQHAEPDAEPEPEADAEFWDDLAGEIADRVTERLGGGLLAITAGTAQTLAQWGGYFCPPMSVGYGPDRHDLLAAINHDGSLELQLRDNKGQPVWHGQLRAAPAAVPTADTTALPAHLAADDDHGLADALAERHRAAVGQLPIESRARAAADGHDG